MTRVHDEPSLRVALDALGIPHENVRHSAVFTVAESESLHQAIPGLHAKNLLLKDKDGRFWLVTAEAHARIDLKALAPAIGAKKVSFGRAEEMERLLGIKPGSVTPLAAIKDVGGAVTVVLDRAIAAAARVNVHPLHNEATLGLSGDDLVRALAAWGHPPVVATVPSLAPDKQD